MKNYFPTVPDPAPDYPALDAYRKLGMMVYLDLDYWTGQSEISIEDYYADLRAHMQSDTYHVVIGEDFKPAGYATWTVDPDDPAKIELNRQSAPFGEHLAQQRALRRHLPHVTTATARHVRSARRDQIAW